MAKPEQGPEKNNQPEISQEMQSAIISRTLEHIEQGGKEHYQKAINLLGFLADPENAPQFDESVVAEPVTERIPVVEETKEEPAVASADMTVTEFFKHKTSKAFERFRGTKTGRRVAVGAIAIGGVLATGLAINSGSNETEQNKLNLGVAPAKAVSSSSSETKEAKAESGWKKDELTPNEENRWKKDGFKPIGDAKTKEEARNAANQWVDTIKGDPDLFKFAYDQLVSGDNLVEHRLFKGDHSTPYAEQKLEKMQWTLAMAQIKKGNADRDLRNPHNTGMAQNGEVVVAGAPGVTGNTQAVIIETIDGKRMAVMERCAQPVVEGQPQNVPVGVTDEGDIGLTGNIPGDKDQGKDINEGDQPEVCPPGLMPYADRCVHPAADGPPPEAEQHRENPGPTPGYPGRGHAEAIVESQQGDPRNLEPTPHGTEVPNSQNGGEAPGGGDESVVSEPPASAPDNPDYVPGSESPGTDEGTSDPAPTEGSDDTSGAGSDPGMPGASSVSESSATSNSSSTTEESATK